MVVVAAFDSSTMSGNEPVSEEELPLDGEEFDPRFTGGYH